MLVPMRVCGRDFSSGMLQEIEHIVSQKPDLSRRALSRELCANWDWRSPNGNLQEMSCRKALVCLDRKGEITLPKIHQVYGFSKTPAGESQTTLELPQVQGGLDTLGPVQVVPLSGQDKEDSRTWNALMRQHHSLGSGPLCGAQIRYLVRAEGGLCLGGLSFSAATWRLKARDQWIAWNEAARTQNLHRVLCNSRFLIAPTVQVPNLASHVLGLALRRLQNDWQERYGYAPVLLETFVDPTRFKGTCYRAANWKHIGQTAARNTPHPNGKTSRGKKDVYVYPLQNAWKTVLCQQPEHKLQDHVPPENPQDWADTEFGNARLYDGRLQRRLVGMARDFFQQPGANIPQACEGSTAKTKAAYRFFANEQVQLEALLQPHKQATWERMQSHPVVLSVQDTTSLNYTTHEATKGLGPLAKSQNKATGLLLHDTLAFTTQGTPLGLVDAQFWARDKVIKKQDSRKRIPTADKESSKWFTSYEATARLQAVCPKSMLVSVCDREADIFELFAHAQKNPAGPKLLIRAGRSKRRTTDCQTRVGEELARQPLAGHLELKIPRKGSRSARTARLAVRFASVTLMPPQKSQQEKPVSVWVVGAQEQGDSGSEVKSPVDWMVVTTVKISTFEEACERLSWYAKRWGIEVYHRTLKSGCRIQDRQLQDAENLEKCLGVDLVVAWRIYWLTQQGRETPDIPCDRFFKEEEWKVLCAYHHKAQPPPEPPPIGKAIPMLAKMGGYLGRKQDGPPGTMTLWRGLMKLEGLVAGVALAQSLHLARDGP